MKMMLKILLLVGIVVVALNSSESLADVQPVCLMELKDAEPSLLDSIFLQYDPPTHSSQSVDDVDPMNGTPALLLVRYKSLLGTVFFDGNFSCLSMVGGSRGIKCNRLCDASSAGIHILPSEKTDIFEVSIDSFGMTSSKSSIMLPSPEWFYLSGATRMQRVDSGLCAAEENLAKNMFKNVVLKQGDFGPSVLRLNELLAKVHLRVDTQDGTFDSMTAEAVKRVEARLGRPLRGIADEEVFRYLMQEQLRQSC